MEHQNAGEAHGSTSLDSESKRCLLLKTSQTGSSKALQVGPIHLHSRPDPLLSSDKSQTGLSFSASPESKQKKAANPVELPEKYELLARFFGAMESSIRLLQLKGSSTTFTNIISKVECLTDRRFSYAHLAKLKFILPESIEIKKILARDERTNCMKPELHIALDANAVEVEKSKSTSRSVQLRKVFRSRLLNFLKSHPQGDHSSGAALPGPFSESKQEVLTILSGSACLQFMGEPPISSMLEQPATASHLSQSFRSSFSNRVSTGKVEEAKQHLPATPIKDIKGG